MGQSCCNAIYGLGDGVYRMCCGGGDDAVAEDEHKYSELPGMKDASFNILLLGAGESGKSTIFKRLVINQGKGYTKDQRAEYTPSIYSNVIESIQTILEKTEDIVKLGYPECEVSFDDVVEQAAQRILDLQHEENITAQVAEDIALIWADEGIQNTFQLRHNFQIPGCASYFFNKVRQLHLESYIPSEMDMLQCRDRSTGIYTEAIKYKKNVFELTDVGGQRNQRKKWEHLYSAAHAVVLTVALSEYDYLCFEDEKTNRLDEALAVFELVAQNKYFQSLPFVLVFNKIDVFKEKLRLGHTFTFHDYEGPQNYDDVCTFVKKTFTEKDSTNHSLKIVFTCALKDPNIFEDVLDYIDTFYKSD